MTTVMSHVGLCADNRLNPAITALFVELKSSVHVAVIGDADRWLTISDCRRNKFVKARRPIKHRELGVDMQVGKRIGHVVEEMVVGVRYRCLKN